MLLLFFNFIFVLSFFTSIFYSTFPEYRFSICNFQDSYHLSIHKSWLTSNNPSTICRYYDEPILMNMEFHLTWSRVKSCPSFCLTSHTKCHQNPLVCSINERSFDVWADMYFCSYVSFTNCVPIALWQKMLIIMIIYICRYQQLTTQHPYVLKYTTSDMFQLCYIILRTCTTLLFWTLPLSIL